MISLHLTHFDNVKYDDTQYLVKFENGKIEIGSFAKRHDALDFVFRVRNGGMILAVPSEIHEIVRNVA